MMFATSNKKTQYKDFHNMIGHKFIVNAGIGDFVDKRITNSNRCMQSTITSPFVFVLMNKLTENIVFTGNSTRNLKDCS